jgi:hypothetical protein
MVRMLLKMLCHQQALFSVQLSERIVILVELGRDCHTYSGTMKTSVTIDGCLPETNRIPRQALECRGDLSEREFDCRQSIHKNMCMDCFKYTIQRVYRLVLKPQTLLGF